MKADTSRSTFDVTRHFRQVFRQQGRVDLDADWNEQQDILDHLRTATTADLIGGTGGPSSAAAFALTAGPDGTDLLLSSGHYYVDGLLLECDGAPTGTSLFAQPDFPSRAVVRREDGSEVTGTPPAGRYLAYVHAWDLHRTALEDETMREVALGGADSTTRVKTVWQVGLLRLGDEGAAVDCASDTPGWKALTSASTGMLEVRAEPQLVGSGPCFVPAAGGFRGVENQHYRVEIHRGGSTSQATFTWARDNASTVAKWVEGPDPNGFITVGGAGRDDALGFTTGMVVELIDDTRELLGEPGTLVRLAEVNGNRLQLSGPAETRPRIDDYPLRPRVRRWDGPDGETATAGPADGSGWIPLEAGVQVRFAADATYRTGDFWLIPARTHLSDVLWPQNPDGTPKGQPPKGIHHRYAKLATVTFDGTRWKDVHDCRDIFPGLTRLVTLRAVSGDGQTALPATDAAQLVDLPEPLVVGVSNGGLPVKGARVRFTVTAGKGALTPDTAHPVESDAGGLASVQWRLSSDTEVQTVRAELLDRSGAPMGLPTEFTASLLTAQRTMYAPNATCPDLRTASTVQEAIDKLCQRPAGLAKQPGLHVTSIHAAATGEDLQNLQLPVGKLQPHGVLIEADDELDPDTVALTSCYVVMDLPYPLTDADSEAWGVKGVAGYQALTLDASAAVAGQAVTTIEWTPTNPAVEFMRKVLAKLHERGMPATLQCRLVLKGNAIMSKDRTRYLDGEVFLDSAEGSTNLRMPSGDDRAGGTFELWFSIVPD
ncbi:DUF6519 domain-containing protein [Streptomyces sp. NPDC001657]|uniref:DUF6519 domain-containing protein n=1 Tax=Streptomyces sp. NPDC001657 TaxID=3154522 RepID=UPI00332400A0